MGPIAGFRGDQLGQADPGYDEARTIFNAMIDRRPALVAKCTGPEDVALAIAFARRERVPLSVRAGGHSVAGLCLNDGGVVIDVRPMKRVEVDARARTARAGAGVTWGELDRATQEHGLATTGGRVSTTGIAGFTIGGGSGWLERVCGLGCDNLLSIRLVTADGRVVRCSEDEHPDLFWAMHGGGGNFGVVTELEFRLHEVGPLVHAGLALYDPAEGREMTRALRDYHEYAPDAAGLAVVYLTAPAEEFVPPEWRGRTAVALAGMWIGDAAEGERALRPLLETVEPVVNLFGPMPYSDFNSMVDDPPGRRNWWTAEYLDDLPEDAIDAFCDYCERMPAGASQALLLPWGGAVARGAGRWPMAGRDAAWVVHPFCMWEDAERDAEHLEWGREVRSVFEPWSTGATYLNFVGDEGEERVRAAFGPHYDRLAAVKARWDPENVFRGNQNIRPAEVVNSSYR